MPRKRKEINPHQKRLLKFISSRHEVKFAEILDEFDYLEITYINSILMRLRRDGYITRPRTGYYQKQISNERLRI